MAKLTEILEIESKRTEVVANLCIIPYLFGTFSSFGLDLNDFVKRDPIFASFQAFGIKMLS